MDDWKGWEVGEADVVEGHASKPERQISTFRDVFETVFDCGFPVVRPQTNIVTEQHEELTTEPVGFLRETIPDVTQLALEIDQFHNVGTSQPLLLHHAC
mmetsp:Transcript_5678/g.8982  ORF Transcript_5678/g.8982 Transcript_5678/m.8982 type:complete len:99 (+) Transcript_5678:1338-1634(+)